MRYSNSQPRSGRLEAISTSEVESLRVTLEELHAAQDELVAAHLSVDEIRELIGATSLGYLSLDGAVRAIGMHKDKFCRACFDGKYPIPVPRDVRMSKLMLEKDRHQIGSPSEEGGPDDGSPDSD